MCRFGVVVLVGLWATASVNAASWAAAMFEEHAKDFGAVPRGPTLTHAFRFTNKTQSAVQVSHVRVSCGCVSAAPSQYSIGPGESATINIQMDTRRFVGHKHVTVYVQFSQPGFDEVRLGVQANGRDDVAVNPSIVSLGKVKKGSSPEATATVNFYGHPGVQITEIERESNFVLAEVKPAGQATSGQFELKIGLRPDTPAGNWYTDVWVKTNHPSVPRLRIPLTVQVESGLALLPAAANFGAIKEGAEVERKILVRGTEPFRIQEISGEDAQVRVQANSLERKATHVLTIKLRPQSGGDLNRKIRIVTDLKDEGEIEVPIAVQVIRAEAAASN